MGKRVFIVAGLALAIGVGCFRQSARDPSAPAVSTANVDSSKFLLASEPEGVVGVIEGRNNAKHQDDVAILGRIGGSEDPWVEGRAAFSIVDVSLKSCLECGSDECPKPWDYC